MRHLNNGTDHRHSKSCCDQSSPARRTMKSSDYGYQMASYWCVTCVMWGHTPITGVQPNVRSVWHACSAGHAPSVWQEVRYLRVAHASHHGFIVDECGWLVMNTWHAWHDGSPCHARHAYDARQSFLLGAWRVPRDVHAVRFMPRPQQSMAIYSAGCVNWWNEILGKFIMKGVPSPHFICWGGWGLGAFLRWWQTSTIWVGPLIFLWPPGMSE